jgi:hypothetical protein
MRRYRDRVQAIVPPMIALDLIHERMGPGFESLSCANFQVVASARESCAVPHATIAI